MQASLQLQCRAVVLALALAAPFQAASAEDVARSTAGLVPLLFQARNQGPAPMACIAATAHWYTVDLGTVAPRSSLRQRFWAAPATGEVFVLNARADRMPVEQLWCGVADRPWSTRDTIPLERHAGQRPPPLQVDCHPAAGSLRCDIVRSSLAHAASRVLPLR